MRFGAVATTTMWVLSYIVAVFSPTPALLYTVTVLRGFSVGIFASSYGAIMFNRARRNDVQFLVLREIPTISGRIVVFVITLILLSFGRFESAFLVVAALYLFFLFNDQDVLVDQKTKEAGR